MTTQVEPRTELTIHDRGRWIVETAHATYHFDLRTGMVKVSGDHGLVPLMADPGLRMQSIEVIRVGEEARWWMRNPLHGVDGVVFKFASEHVTSIVSAWRPAVANGATVADSFLGTALTPAAMCERLGITPDQLERLVDEDLLLQVVTADGRPLFPAFQVTEDHTLLPYLDSVLGELSDDLVDEGCARWQWLVSRPAFTEGRALWEMLRDGDPEPVIRAAGRSAWAWRR